MEQNIQDTLLLKQRFLENKAKRNVKKSDKKFPDSSLPNTSHSLPKFPTKRSASEEADINSDKFSEPPPNKASQPQKQSHENLTKFSVEIVQQLEFTTTTTNSQISTNVTVKALNTSVKSDILPTSQPSKPPSPVRNVDIVECKQEPQNMEFVDLEQCAAALEKDAAANGGNSFPGFSDLIGDDTSDAIITSDAFKDLISEISDFNPEFMKDFDFDGGEQRNHNVEEHPIKIENSIGNQNQRSNSTSSLRDSLCQQQQQQNKLVFAPGIDFTKAESNPAAQTLKQMAEQHQHKTQMGLSFNLSRPNPKAFDFQYSNSSDYGSTQNSNQASYKQTITSPPCTFNPDNVKQEVFSGQNSPVSFSPGRNVPSPQSRLGSQYKQQYASYGSPGANGNSQFNGRQQSQPSGPQTHQQPPPPRPSSRASTIQSNQSQQLQTQGPVQVSMAQNVNAEVKGGNMSLGAHQAVYLTGNQASYCSVSQSQTINFTQQTLRQRAPQVRSNPQPPPTHIIRNHHPVIDMMTNPGVQINSRPEFKTHGHHMLRFPQPRGIPLQTIPSCPINRTPGPTFNTSSVNSLHLPRVSYNTANPLRQLPQHHASDSGPWRHNIPQQGQPQFHQAQNVTYSSNDTQLSVGQVQQMNMAQQHQTLGLHHINPTMSLRVQMSQNMSNGVYTTSGSRQAMAQHPALSSATYGGVNVSSSYTTPTYISEQALQQQQLQLQPSVYTQNGIPSDFNLDFLEQFPGNDHSNFSDQEFLNSLDSGASFNFQDIL